MLLWQATERPLMVVVDGNQSGRDADRTHRNILRPAGSPATAGGRNHPCAGRAARAAPLAAHRNREQRAIGLWRLAAGKTSDHGHAGGLGAAAHGIRRVLPPARARRCASAKSCRSKIVLAHLESIGYERREPVEMVGEYSMRGGILDVFPAESGQPVAHRVLRRCDRIHPPLRRGNAALGDEGRGSHVRCRWRSIRSRASAARHRGAGGRSSPGDPFPGWEFLVPLVRPRAHSLLCAGRSPLVDVGRAGADRRRRRPCFGSACEEQTAHFPARRDKNFYAWEELARSLESKAEVAARELELITGEDPRRPAPPRTRPSLAFHGNMQVAVAEARNLVEQGYRVAFFAPSNGELERLADILREYSVPFQLGLAPNEAALALSGRARLSGRPRGQHLSDQRPGAARRRFSGLLASPSSARKICSTPPIWSRGRASPKRSCAAFAADLADLKPGDFVVHVTHGVGQFLGLREIVQGEPKGDFMLLEYAGDAKLYVPLTRMDLVEKYRGAGEGARRRSTGWAAPPGRTQIPRQSQNARHGGRAAQALRPAPHGRGLRLLARFSNWQREFEDAFEFTETKDQLTAIKEIKRDMEAPHPMDRLLCGDVGYGKTEVAMRAAFKALGDGKQVAVLAPTTVLAFQHFETFKRRFARVPGAHRNVFAASVPPRK